MKAKTLTTEPKINRMNMKGAIMKKIKKLIATALATALCLALSVPCFAASAPSKDAVRLKVGESYTIGDTTITIK